MIASTSPFMPERSEGVADGGGTLERLGAPPWSYVCTAGAVALSFLARYILRGQLGFTVPYLLFYPPVVVMAWLGGLGPGLVATALCALAAMYWLLPPDGLAVTTAADQLSLGVFVLTGAVIAMLNERLHRTQNTLRGEATAAAARAERLDTILNTSVDGIIVIDSRGQIEAFNRGAEVLFGYPAVEVLGRNVNMLMPSPNHEDHDGYLRRYLETGEAQIIGVGREVTGRRRDGTFVPVHLSVGEMRIGGQRKFTGLLHDLTKREGLSQQLQASEARWRAVVDSAVDGIVVIDTHGRIESFNHAAERLFGYAEPDVLGRNVDMLMPSPYHEEHDTYLARYLATGRAKIIGLGREVQGLRNDGTTFPLHLSVGELTIRGERKFVGLLHDLTNRVRLEGQLREQETLARLGEMAAVLAHEVKNPLAGIRGAIQVVGSRLPADNPSGPILKEIVSRIDSLDSMMKDLLLFARPPKPRLQSIDVSPVLTTTVALLGQDPGMRELAIDVEGS
jgi:PAS domain S-box-containing protein